MTQPVSYDFAIRRGSSGDYAAIIFALLQDDGETPASLAGATATLTIAMAIGTTLVLSSAIGGELALDAAAGTVAWRPTRAETLAITPGRIDTYDLTIAFPNGSQGPYLTGYLIGLDDGDPVPRPCGSTGAGSPDVARVIKVLVPGPPGPAGPPGISASAPASYQISAAASYTAAHGLPFPPEVWIVTPGGEPIETDIRHAPGATTAIFPQPFTGTLYLR